MTHEQNVLLPWDQKEIRLSLMCLQMEHAKVICNVFRSNTVIYWRHTLTVRQPTYACDAEFSDVQRQFCYSKVQRNCELVKDLLFVVIMSLEKKCKAKLIVN